MVRMDGVTAVCEMHSYRVEHRKVWEVEVPAGIILPTEVADEEEQQEEVEVSADGQVTEQIRSSSTGTSSIDDGCARRCRRRKNQKEGTSLKRCISNCSARRLEANKPGLVFLAFTEDANDEVPTISPK